MAKEDFCYTYYDGDAARDKAHMTRLERGAYDDIISAQRKRGRLSILDIKRVLGSDFEACFPSMEWVLIKDESEKYYIEWVEKSIKNMQENSARNKKKIQDYWDKKNQKDTTDIPQYNHSKGSEEPLEDGNEDGNGNVFKEVNKGEKFLVDEMIDVFMIHNKNYPTNRERDAPAVVSIHKFLCSKMDIPRPEFSEVRPLWEKISKYVSQDDFHRNFSLSQIDKHIQSVTQKIQNGTNSTKNKGLSAERLREAHARTFGGL